MLVEKTSAQFCRRNFDLWQLDDDAIAKCRHEFRGADNGIVIL